MAVVTGQASGDASPGERLQDVEPIKRVCDMPPGARLGDISRAR